MKVSTNRFISDMCKFLEKEGAQIDSIEKKKHGKIKFRYRGKPRMLVVSISPSSNRSEQYGRSDAKRMMRQIDQEAAAAASSST